METFLQSFSTTDYALTVIALIWMLLDILTGFIQALYNHTVDSVKLRQGLMHKAAFIAVIVVAYLCQLMTGFYDFGFEIPLIVAVCVYICCTELASCLENIGMMNKQLADSRFLQIFKSLKSSKNDDSDSDDEEDE